MPKRANVNLGSKGSIAHDEVQVSSLQENRA